MTNSNNIYGETAGMSGAPVRCRAKDPATCRYHGYGKHGTHEEVISNVEARNEAQYGGNVSTLTANGSREPVKTHSLRDKTKPAPANVSKAVKGAVRAKKSIENKPARLEKKSVSELSDKFNASTDSILDLGSINTAKEHMPDVHSQSFA